MTGPPHETDTGKTPATTARDHPMPEAASTATLYQLSLASVLPWLQGDRNLRTSNINAPGTSSSHSGNNSAGVGGNKSQVLTATLPPGGSSSNSPNTKLYTSAACSSNSAPIGNHASGVANMHSANSAPTKRVYNIQLPLLYPPGRSLRPYGSFSSGSAGSGSGSGGGSSSTGRPGSGYTTGMSLAPPGPLPQPPSLSTQGFGVARQEFALVVRGRGLSRTPIDDPHPIDNLRDYDLFSRTVEHNVQRALESQFETPCSSGRASPTITATQSPLSVSHGGWTTGDTTERSCSLDSSYSLEEFDKQAANTVSQHFDEIKSVLFEGPRDAVRQQAGVFRECQEWSSQFPHLRVLGKQACPPKDTGFYHVPSTRGSRPTSSSILLDVTDNDISMSSDSQGLTLTGCSVSARRAPVGSLSGNDSESSAYSFLVEEVIEEDGVYEDVIAVDYKNIYEDNIEYKKQITPRRRRVGYPPITPNACVKDSVISGAFDHIWNEIMSWMRQLLKKYTSEITDSKHDVISFSPTNPHQSTPISRELSLFMANSRQHSFQHSNTHLGSSTDRSIDGILHITSMSLKNRHPLMDPTESHVLGSVRPGSSIQSPAQVRPMSNLRASHRGTRGGRLAPLAKTPNTEDERPSRAHAAIDALRVKGLTPSSNDPLPSPPSNFQRNGALPPLDQRKPHQGYRATSAIDNKDKSLLNFRERGHFAGEPARPNTTHAMRSETPFGGYQSRRSSTPLGNAIMTRNSLLTNKSLDVRGNSLQPSGEVGHFHPDIQEDQQESPGEDNIYRTPWNPPQPSHVYRRSRLITLSHKEVSGH